MVHLSLLEKNNIKDHYKFNKLVNKQTKKNTYVHVLRNN